MAHFLKAEDIPMAKRRPHLDRYRRQLRDALMNPALTPEQRAHIKLKIDTAGKPKVYGGKPITPPVIATPKPSSPAPTPDEGEKGPEAAPADLLDLTRDELLTLAKAEGIDVRPSWTKAKLVEVIGLSRGK